MVNSFFDPGFMYMGVRGLDYLLKEVNYSGFKLVGEFRGCFKLSMKPVVILCICGNLGKFSGKSLQIGFIANYLVINNCDIKRVQILVHKTNMQKYIRKIAKTFGITIIRTYI